MAMDDRREFDMSVGSGSKEKPDPGPSPAGPGVLPLEGVRTVALVGLFLIAVFYTLYFASAVFHTDRVGDIAEIGVGAVGPPPDSLRSGGIGRCHPGDFGAARLGRVVRVFPR